MRNRETVLTYKEKNGLFIHMKYKVIRFFRIFGICTKFLLLIANTQNVIQQEENKQLYFFLNVTYCIFLICMEFQICFRNRDLIKQHKIKWI